MGATFTIAPCVRWSSSRVKVLDAAGGDGRPSVKVCDAADAPASFRSDVRKRFGFPPHQEMRKENSERRTVNRFIIGIWRIYTIWLKFYLMCGLRHGENLPLLITVDDIIRSMLALRWVLKSTGPYRRKKGGRTAGGSRIFCSIPIIPFLQNMSSHT